MGKQHHLPVRVDDVAVFGDNAQPVAVAIKGQAQFGIGFAQRAFHVFEIFELAGVRVVVGKVAIHGAVQFQHVTAQRTEDARRRGARHAVAAVHHDFHGARHDLLDFAQTSAGALAAGLYGARQENVAHDALAIGGQYVHLPHAAAVLQLPVFSFHGLAQGLNFVAINGAALQHHFETVVVFGVVAARNLYAAVAQGMRGKVEHGGSSHANVDDLHACFYQPRHECGCQLCTTQTPVAPNGYRFAAQCHSAAAKGAPERTSYVRGDGGGHYAAYVIGFEYAG